MDQAEQYGANTEHFLKIQVLRAKSRNTEPLTTLMEVLRKQMEERIKQIEDERKNIEERKRMEDERKRMGYVPKSTTGQKVLFVSPLAR